MTTQLPFSATDSLTGYLFQVKYALLDALRRLKEDVEFSVSIETLDDVVFQKPGQPADLIQVKHHTKPANLTDASPDLWKTIRIWVEQYNAGNLMIGTRFYLVTTANISANSIAYYLKPNQVSRDISKAILRLDEVSQSSTNQENKPAYDVYRSLDINQKAFLLNSVIIIDSVPVISDIDSEIRREVLLVVDKKFIQSFVERVEQWWYRRALMHLTKDKQEPILSEEILAELGALREQFKQDNLPVYEEIISAAIDDTIYQDRIFVQQLKLIEVSSKRIFFAVRDYFRAFEQRSRWIREDLLQSGEVEKYEQSLIEDWEMHFEQMRDMVGEEITDKEKLRLAQEIYAWVETGDLKQIRPRVSESSLARGSYHILSDRQVVGWHPEFREKLMQVLGV